MFVIMTSSSELQGQEEAVVSCKVKKKQQHACTYSGLRDHYSKLFMFCIRDMHILYHIRISQVKNTYLLLVHVCLVFATTYPTPLHILAQY